MAPDNTHTEAGAVGSAVKLSGAPATPSPASPLLTKAEAAAYLRFDTGHANPEEAVRYLCRQGKVRHMRRGRTVLFRREWLDEYIESETVEPV